MRNIKIQIYILFIVIFLPVIGVNAQSSWVWLQPLPTGATLNSVDFWDRNTGYTCGKAGTVTKTTNGGLNWVLLGQITSLNLTDIECINLNTCIVVGDSGYIAKTTNGGLNWVSISIGISSFLYSVNFPSDSDTGFVCGTGGTFLKTTNTGLNWLLINVGVSSTLFHVSFINPLKGAMAGINNIYTTTNGGNNWTIHQLGTFFDYFEEVTYVNDTTIYGLFIPTGGAAYFYKSLNSGISWSGNNIEGLSPGEIARSMTFLNYLTGFTSTNYGRIHKTTNSGVNWIIDTSFTAENNDVQIFWKIKSFDTSDACAVGSGGMIVKTTNSGERWEKQVGNIKTYNDIYFTTINTGYIVGEKGLLLKTTDSGLNWNRIELGTTVGLNKVFFTNETTGYICGDTGLLKKTTNGGLNWISLITPAGDTNILCMTFLDENIGYLGMLFGSILKSVDGGNTWERIFTHTGTGNPSIQAIDFLNSSYGAAAAPNRILLTSNSGMNWIAINQGGNDLLTIHYLDSLNIISGGYDDKIRKSTNGGFSWFSINNQMGSDIISMFFWDSNYGVMCGNSGKIAKTTNGGINWTIQPVIASEILKSIFFINPNTGFAAGQGGQIIKTTNGGLSFINTTANNLPTTHQLFQNYPNPFNPSTKIKFQMIKTGYAEIKIYNINGKFIRTLLSENRSYGTHEIEFNAADLPSGIYFYELLVNNNLIEIKKCMLIK